MALKDLSEYLTPDLELPHGGKVYTVKPPTKNTGLILAAINALGAAAWSGPEAVDKVPQSMRDLAKTVEDKDLGELSLGEDVYRQMNEDGVPGPHIDTFALYALYYWTIGEESADQLIALRAGKHDPKAAARARSKSGRSTASGSRKTGSTGSRSTPTTASRKAQPGASFKKETQSGGQKSSPTGT